MVPCDPRPRRRGAAGGQPTGPVCRGTGRRGRRRGGAGHTHMPFGRLRDRRRVVNPGSVGVPRGTAVRPGRCWGRAWSCAARRTILRLLRPGSPSAPGPGGLVGRDVRAAAGPRRRGAGGLHADRAGPDGVGVAAWRVGMQRATTRYLPYLPYLLKPWPWRATCPPRAELGRSFGLVRGPFLPLRPFTFWVHRLRVPRGS